MPFWSLDSDDVSKCHDNFMTGFHNVLNVHQCRKVVFLIEQYSDNHG